MTAPVLSPSPHLHSGASTRRIMLDVIIALCPAAIASVIIFGWRSALLIAVCVAAAVAGEYICRRIMKRPNTCGDLSAVVTGLLLALNLPVTLPVWMAALGSVVAIVVVKQFFGGIGQNFANPAITARIVLMLSFTSYMTAWVSPSVLGDAVTSASPLGGAEVSTRNQLLGLHAGCLGETCALALLAGGIYLSVRRVINPLVPLTFIGTTALMMWAFGGDPLYHILTGGLLLGAIFMATDYATTPSTLLGRVIFAAGCGIITALIRQFGSLPEGVSFSILLMNIITPLIDRAVITRPFGSKEAKR